MSSQTLTTLKAARSLLQKGFVQNHYATRADGLPVGSCSSDAVCWCIAGAIDNVVKHDESLFMETWNVILKHSGVPTKETIKKFGGFSQDRAVGFLTEIIGDTIVSTKATPKTKIDISQLLS